jgi:outer membrane lipoprotein carrier protein
MNKKTLASVCMALAFSCSSTHLLAQENVSEHYTNSASKSILMAKLYQLNFFTAHFSQQVLSESGDIIEESTGKLAISKPNLANWQVLTPDELSIVSDGANVWFYNPWIEQVSVYALSAAIARTPILLLTSKDETLWQQYKVVQEDSQGEQESFVISAIDANSQIKSLTLVFNEDAQLSQFSFLDATGQLSHVTLSQFNDQHAPKQDLFHFVVPQDTQIDDQR